VERVVELGILASREGRSDEAETLLREGLEYAQALVDKELAIWCLVELAALALSKETQSGRPGSPVRSRHCAKKPGLPHTPTSSA
jgi:hypothetical protein